MAERNEVITKVCYVVGGALIIGGSIKIAHDIGWYQGAGYSATLIRKAVDATTKTVELTDGSFVSLETYVNKVADAMMKIGSGQ